MAIERHAKGYSTSKEIKNFIKPYYNTSFQKRLFNHIIIGIFCVYIVLKLLTYVAFYASLLCNWTIKP